MLRHPDTFHQRRTSTNTHPSIHPPPFPLTVWYGMVWYGMGDATQYCLYGTGLYAHSLALHPRRALGPHHHSPTPTLRAQSWDNQLTPRHPPPYPKAYPHPAKPADSPPTRLDQQGSRAPLPTSSAPPRAAVLRAARGTLGLPWLAPPSQLG